MAISFTPMQELAIKTRDRTLLVSAAAGSGKTATLTQRIISSILDSDNRIGIEDMLIVTFTRAAVGELRERIGKAIKNAIEEHPDDAHLVRQLYMLPAAKISTIDSFCSSILRANCARVGVNPGFRVADTAEAEILAESILDGLISEIYEGREPEVATPAQFETLADCMTDTRTQDELAAIIRTLYNSTLSSLEGVGSIAALIEEYNPARFESIEKTRLIGYAIERVKEAASHYKGHFEAIVCEIDAIGNPKSMKLRDVLASDISWFKAILSATTYRGLREALYSYDICTTPSSGDKSLPPTTSLRASMKSELVSMREDYFSYKEEDIRKAYAALYAELSTLVRVLNKFDELFRQEKIRRGILEYSDIERLTYECLWQGGELTEVAHAERALYRAVYIDEYQDVNNLQNKIFEAVSPPFARFMVGDIKQSIYGFRSANTDIFAAMKNSFAPMAENSPPNASTIFMSENFRCDEGVVDFVNDVFDKIFYHLRDSIGYVDGDRLKFAKGNSVKYRYPEICVADKAEFSRDEDKKTYTPYVVARKIKELLECGTLDNGERIRPSDIAIIMRSAKGKEGYYKAALDSIGIPAAVADDTTFFLNSEVLLALALLNTIDNPRRDIYLVGLLCSPLYSFSPNDLAKIRSYSADTFYESLVGYTEANPDFEKGASFLRELSYYRMLSEGMPTDELISMLFKTTGLMALGAARGGKDNLLLLYEYARKFEAGSYKGLYNFISYVNSVIDRKNSFDKREAPTDGDSVRIITVHSSKGLEFPVVFFVGGEESINRSFGASQRYVYKENFGIGMFARTQSGLGLVENPTKAIINEYIRRSELEESARILYVALTRAREQLYIVATAGKKYEDFLTEIDTKREFLDDYSVYSLSSYLEFMLCSKKQRIMTAGEFLSDTPPFLTGIEAELTEDSTGNEDVRELDDDGDHTLSDTLIERFNFKYPDLYKTEIPEKVSVSKLYPEILDGTGEDVLDLTDEPEDYTLRPLGAVPEFIGGEENDAKMRGIATHLLLQFCNLEGLVTNGAKAELERLKRERFISQRDAGLVRLYEADMFARSRLCRDMMAAEKIYREFRFNVKLPATLFAKDPHTRAKLSSESLLVQGVIDCLWLDNEGNYHLVDYKTDRLTKEELADRTKAEEKLRAAHSVQLGYYREAVKLIFGKYPSTTEVYSLPLGDTVSVADA